MRVIDQIIIPELIKGAHYQVVNKGFPQDKATRDAYREYLELLDYEKITTEDSNFIYSEKLCKWVNKWR